MWAGHAIMQGKFVCNQSPSTFLFLNRFSIAAAFIEPGTAYPPAQLLQDGPKWEAATPSETASHPSLQPYFATVKSAFPLPDTVTGFD